MRFLPEPTFSRACSGIFTPFCRLSSLHCSNRVTVFHRYLLEYLFHHVAKENSLPCEAPNQRQQLDAADNTGESRKVLAGMMSTFLCTVRGSCHCLPLRQSCTKLHERKAKKKGFRKARKKKKYLEDTVLKFGECCRLLVGLGRLNMCCKYSANGSGLHTACILSQGCFWHENIEGHHQALVG